MEDVRLYIRDALTEYARLQTFAPRPSWDAVCYSGHHLLDEGFGFPHSEDREVSCLPMKLQACRSLHLQCLQRHRMLVLCLLLLTVPYLWWCQVWCVLKAT